MGGLIKRKEKIVTGIVAPGSYIHIGIQKQLEKIKDVLLQRSTNDILLDICIDGLPLFKSSAIGLWPILEKVADINLTFFLLEHT